MQYAVINGERAEPLSGGRGQCPICRSDMIAKCGQRILHHWAHKGRRNCDPWWENETQWHRDWKSRFPRECREIHHRARDGEIHRADVRTASGIYIEIQHSPMPDAERCAREDFYGNLLWIVDGRGFGERFRILHPLPDPRTAIATEIVWFPAHPNWRSDAIGVFYRVSETRRSYPDMNITKSNLHSLDVILEVHGLESIRSEVEEAYAGHHQYYWVRPRRTWLDSPCPVFIDLGGDLLAKLESYDDYGLPCVRLVTGSRLVEDAMSCAFAGSVGVS